MKKSKVRQVMADLALSQVANRCTENLTKSEYRRLIIGVQLIKDPGLFDKKKHTHTKTQHNN